MRTLANKFVVAIAALGLLATGAIASVVSQSAEAADASKFNPGMIITDEQFYDETSMNADEIQKFLDEKGQNCTGSNCLKDHRQDTQSYPANLCKGYVGQRNESAATIIEKVAKSCDINPKVLLVMLEKETSLVTMDNPAEWRYDRAMGYYCPDDPNRPGWCHPDYAGFFNQVFDAAGQLQNYKNNPDSFGYRAGRTHNILYNPDGSCGTKSVYVENVATASLYIYTPYTPNEAAMNNLYGEGDGCSSYGNRNFWRLFTDWFGPTDAPVEAPKPDPKPEIKPEPKPEPKPSATETVKPAPKPTPTATPKPTASATPTETAKPTETAGVNANSSASKGKGEAETATPDPVPAEEVTPEAAPAEPQAGDSEAAKPEAMSVIPKPAAPQDLPMNNSDAHAAPKADAKKDGASTSQPVAPNAGDNNGSMSVVPRAQEIPSQDAAATDNAANSEAEQAEAAPSGVMAETGSTLTIAGVLILAAVGLAGVILVAASRRLSR